MRKYSLGLFLVGSLTLIGCGGSPVVSNSLASANPAAATTTSSTPTSTTPTSPASSTPTSSTPTSTTTSSPTGSTSTSAGTTTTPTSGSTSPTTSTPSSLLPTIPSTATVFDSIQNNTTGWWDCSDCAGGTITTSYFNSPFQTTHSLSGSSREFSISGPAWASALWVNKLGAHNSTTHFLWDFYVYFDSASATGTWSAEYDFWQAIAGQQYMIGSQCVFGTNEWDLWDSSINHWINSGLPCPRFTPNTWHHIQWDLERISSTQYRYNTLFVDGQAFALNKVFNSQPTNWDDGMGVQWQLDQNGSGVALNEWVDNVKLTLW